MKRKEIEPKPLKLYDLKKIKDILDYIKKFKKNEKKFYNILVDFVYSYMVIKYRIRQACEFYLKYFDNPDLLIKDFPKYKKELIKLLDIKPPFYGHFYSNSDYNEWLFKLAFKDIFENENK